MKWISVEDSLPIDYENVKDSESVEVLIVSGGEVEHCDFVCGRYSNNVAWYEFDNFHNSFVTHWMPLPEPPNELNKG